MDINQFSGEKIKEFRKKRGLNQEDLAEHLSMSQSAYAKIENGHTALDVKRLIQLSEYFEVPVSDFLPNQKEHVYQLNSQDGYQNLQVENFYADGRSLLKSKDAHIQHLEKEIEFLREQLSKK